MPADRALCFAAFVCFVLAVPQLPQLAVRFNLVALGLALGALALLHAGGGPMDLVQLVVVLIVVGVLLWLVEAYLPIDPTIKKIIHVVVLIAVILWLLTVFGLLPLGRSIRVGPG
jgi:hypothetical protein